MFLAIGIGDSKRPNRQFQRLERLVRTVGIDDFNVKKNLTVDPVI